MIFITLEDTRFQADAVTLATAAGACERSAQWQQALCLLSTARQELLGSSGYNRPVGKASRRWRVMISNSSYRSRTIWWLIKLFCRVDGWGMFNSYDTRLEQAFLTYLISPVTDRENYSHDSCWFPSVKFACEQWTKDIKSPAFVLSPFWGNSRDYILGQQQPTGTFWLVY